MCGAGDSECSGGGDHDTDADGDVAGGEDEVELVVDVDEPVKRDVGTQPDTQTHDRHARQLNTARASVDSRLRPLVAVAAGIGEVGGASVPCGTVQRATFGEAKIWNNNQLCSSKKFR